MVIETTYELLNFFAQAFELFTKIESLDKKKIKSSEEVSITIINVST